MSSFVEKIIDEKNKQIKAESIEAINKIAKEATARFQSQIELLKEQAKIVLPVNIIDILTSGGTVFSTIHDVPYDRSQVKLIIADCDILQKNHSDWYESWTFLKGKYRVTLLLEKLGPPEKSDC